MAAWRLPFIEQQILKNFSYILRSLFDQFFLNQMSSQYRDTVASDYSWWS